MKKQDTRDRQNGKTGNRFTDGCRFAHNKTRSLSTLASVVVIGTGWNENDATTLLKEVNIKVILYYEISFFYEIS